MSFRDNEWTILEKLLLSQAVYQHGEHSWLQVSSTLKQHALIQHRQSDFFDHKNCSLQYDLLVENLISEKDTSIVVQLAKDLYTQRIEEIKNALVHGEQEVGALVSEIDLIRKGELDDKIRGEYQTKPRPQEKISEQVENLEIMHEEWTEDVVMGEQEENSSMKEEWAKIMEQDVQENQDMEPMQIEEEKVEEREACGMERMEADVKERSQVKDREDMMRTEK
ncbi:hypothetical protein G6F56_012563 [Rhizopus delemar]|nr:hypothetical protein G6F56_012563 [Rhizopus delemar]